MACIHFSASLLIGQQNSSHILQNIQLRIYHLRVRCLFEHGEHSSASFGTGFLLQIPNEARVSAHQFHSTLLLRSAEDTAAAVGAHKIQDPVRRNVFMDAQKAASVDGDAVG